MMRAAAPPSSWRMVLLASSASSRAVFPGREKAEDLWYLYPVRSLRVSPILLVRVVKSARLLMRGR
jgi:hypothetical protein